MLKFKSWKYVKKDIEQMENNIEIMPLINKMNISLTILLLDYLYYISENVIKVYEEAGKFVTKYNLNNPCIVKYSSIEEYRKGNIEISPIDFRALESVFNEVRNHPHINVELNKP
ncbi:MAG: hypothetical protein RSD36_12990 [Terrisporobacter sp.]